MRDGEERPDGPMMAQHRDGLHEGRELARAGHGRIVSYSPKVFIPLTQLCRDVCHYCAFAKTPNKTAQPYLSPDRVLEIAQQGKAARCHEALFTLGDKPELRYRQAADALKALGHETTVAYLHAMCKLVLQETGLLPHVNAGVMSESEMASLREVSASQGLMLESSSERLCQPDGVHHGSPDKHPALRLKMIENAGRLRIPFTTGILIGIGETRAERLESLAAIAKLHERYGHIQEVIIQNFRAKPGTKMSVAAEPDLDDLLWTIAKARKILGKEMNIQAPPNLSPNVFPRLLEAGLNDWGGISPVTPDHVNPEAPWPHLVELERATAKQAYVLVPRLAVYPQYCLDAPNWLAPDVHKAVAACMDAQGYARVDSWCPGVSDPVPAAYRAAAAPAVATERHASAAIDAALAGRRLDERAIASLFETRGPEEREVLQAADALRQANCGQDVSYVVNRNLNYTNLCVFKCGFCAFSKGQGKKDLRGVPYDLDDAEITRRVHEAWRRGATEICMQGGIHPGYTGDKYLALARLVKAAEPQMHLHAFSPLEVAHGAQTLGISIGEFLAELKRAGVGTLPGTAAEILDDDLRLHLCPEKMETQGWLDVVRQAHRAGLRSTATIMFGHIDHYLHWARHLLHIRDLQAETGGFTEFVPLPFIHMEAPMSARMAVRHGPTFREVLLMHAIARLVLHPYIQNIQASWVKLGRGGATRMLAAGVNDLGGTLMNESISRAAGAEFGQEMAPAAMDAMIMAAGRVPRMRNTLYGSVSSERAQQAYGAAQVTPIVLTPVNKARYRAPANA